MAWALARRLKRKCLELVEVEEREERGGSAGGPHEPTPQNTTQNSAELSRAAST